MRKRKAGARQIRPHVGGVPDKCCKGVRNRGKIKSRHLPRKDAVKNYAIKKPRAQSARRGHGENNRGGSIHAPTGGATDLAVHLRTIAGFQFTRPRGARPTSASSRRGPPVSIHAPTGGATRRACAAGAPSAFQFTRPRGARPQSGWVVDKPEARFNSRAHGGRDRKNGGANETEGVSIHAPTGGATGVKECVGDRQEFQFTRPRGARRQAILRARRRQGFNSRAHGGRDFHAGDTLDYFGVSIHAPTGGATAVAKKIEGGAKCFNSRAHGGRDRSAMSATRRFMVSIHAPTGGATRALIDANFAKRVSIHAPTGGATAAERFDLRSHFVSIHAPTGGATRTPECAEAKFTFQFTRPRGARPNGNDSFGSAKVSIHAPTGGATIWSFCPRFPLWFQFTRPRGARRPRFGRPLLIRLFQFTRPRGARQSISSAWKAKKVSIHAPTGGATRY